MNCASRSIAHDNHETRATKTPPDLILAHAGTQLSAKLC
jgi:hypothetical protein